jgi:hypothetical protein
MRANSVLTPSLFSLVLLFSASDVESKAQDRKFEAELIWGTDQAKPDAPDLKPVDPELVERLQKIFKWKHYYQVRKKDFIVAAKPKPGTLVVLSDKCEIEVTDKGMPMTEVKLFGEKKLVKTIKQAITQCLVIAGDDRNDTAWFVVLTPK